MRKGAFIAVLAGSAAIAYAVLSLIVRDRPLTPAPAVDLAEATLDAAARAFPIQYEAWKQPSREVPMDTAPWREKRGHAFSLKDRDEDGPLKLRPLPAGCLDCHAARKTEHPEKPGLSVLSRVLSYWEARRTIDTPVACVSCHARPAEHGAPVCAECHVEYYVSNGVVRRPPEPEARAIEAYYDRAGYSDWVDPATGAALIEPQHPQYEIWREGTHARSGVTCADCHMPRLRAGAIRITDHRAASPLKNLGRACGPCHRMDETELRTRVKFIQDRTAEAEARAQDALSDLVDRLRAARDAGVSGALLDQARRLERRAHWRIAFVLADRSKGFHAPHETAALLLEALDAARCGSVSLSPPADRRNRLSHAVGYRITGD